VELQTVDLGRWFCFSVNPVYGDNHEFLGVAFSAVDIDKRKRLEMERQKITDDLIARNRDLEQFAYIVSHNLRAPIANIIGLGEIIKRSDDAKRKVILSSLDTSISRLDDVVRDLNDILQVKRNLSESRVSIALNALVENIKASLGQTVRLTNTEIETDFSEAPELLSIRSYLYSIFYNLISNSIKYGLPSRSPRLQIYSKRSGDQISIHFRDNGSGIDLDKYGDELFGMYKRFHPEKEGKGLGLFMTKHQVEALGATIDVASTPNKGTEFTITFNA
jgi:signal transduction histidine kinase